jgi:cytochrome c55X
LLRGLLIFGLLVAAGTALAGSPGTERQGALLYLLRQDCGSCHGLTMRGGLGPPLLPLALADKPDGALVEAILDGRPGTPMPPWRFSLTPEEAGWMIRRLKEGLSE